jgi:uncharacterized protein (DUF433 family)
MIFHYINKYTINPLPFATVVGMVADGMKEEILKAFPDLEPEDIQEALPYTAFDR